MELIGSRLGADIDDGSIAAAEFTRKIAGLDLDFLHRFQARHDGGLTRIIRIRIHRAVENVVVAAIAIAVDRHHW